MTRDTKFKAAVLTSEAATLTILRMSDWQVWDWALNAFSANPGTAFASMTKVGYTFPGSDNVQLYEIEITTANYIDGLYIMVYCDTAGSPLTGIAQDYMMIVDGSNTPTYAVTSGAGGWRCPPHPPRAH